MFSSLVSSFASLISYTPYVFNQTLADGYWQNYNNGRVLHSLEGVPAEQKQLWRLQQWKVDSNPLSFYTAAICVLYLLYVSRCIYRYTRSLPPQALEKNTCWVVLAAFLGCAARVVCDWMLNLYYEGTLHGSRQDLIVPSQEYKMHHSLLSLYIPLIGIGFQSVMRHQAAEDRKARHQPEPTPQPLWDGWHTELSTLARLIAYGFGTLFSFASVCAGFGWLTKADPNIASAIMFSPIIVMVLWAVKDDILATTWADIRGWLYIAYTWALWPLAIYSLTVSLWMYLAVCAGLIHAYILTREHAKAA